ncbi:hypothetical protein [Aurantiacibacter gilvus]|uniref:DUF4019 domain-containing protein n=1 Tax=Aurantiacibacter gilvus TaxID=3139141 RepID=A0ABU9IDS4_9SPHN
MRKILAVTAVALLAACNPMEQMDGAETLIEEFHADFNESDFNAIWNGASQEFRESLTRAEFDDFMSRMRTSVGEYQDGSQVGFNINTNNGTTLTEITLDTTYENGTADEVFTFIGTGDDMALLNWNIDSTAPWAEPEVAEPAPGTAGEKPGV